MKRTPEVVLTGDEPGHSTDPSGLTLTLDPKTVVFRCDHRPTITARLTNTGNCPLTLVLPGDGSHEAWRTPIIEWAFIPGGKLAGSGARVCGNVTALKRGEVFRLLPGQTREIRDGILPACLPSSSRFRAAMTYSNEPDRPFLGVPLRPHDEAELALVRQSNSCRVRSNEIEFAFEDYPGAARDIWFPEVVTTLQRRWSDGLTFYELIALRDDLQRRLHLIRADRGIEPAMMWIAGEPFSEIRVRQWCDEPEITVRGLILALGRYRIAEARTVEGLERGWRLFRIKHGLDLSGARAKPQRRSS